MTTYLLDSNIFIQSKNFHYRFEFCQAFWDLIINLHKQGHVFSIKKVKDELIAGDDDLSIWIKKLPDSFWIDEFEHIGDYQKVMTWAYAADFTDKAKEVFAEAKIADAWLVASAASHANRVIVTQEARVDSNIKRQIKIPNAAEYFQVTCLTLYDFLSATCHNNFTPI